MVNSVKTSKEKLMAILDEAIAKDAALRDEFRMGDKFRFIREKLHALHDSVSAALVGIKEESAFHEPAALAADETVVYVYLFNAQGVLVPTWRKMVQASVLYEYSVNRPIYRDQSVIEAIIRGKTDKQQHAYLAIAVKNEHMLPLADDVLIRVKEGSLSHQRILFFKHNDNEYRVSATGELIKKIF